MMRKTIFGIIIALLIVLSSYIAVAPVWYGSGDDSRLVGRWSCEGNFKDSSGQGNHGTQSGGVTITNGVKGRACGFDGVNDYISLNLGSHVGLSSSYNKTISSWIKLNSIQSDARFIYSEGDWNGNKSASLAFYTSYLRCNIGLDWSSGAAYAISNFNANQWYYVACLANSSGNYLFINGNLVNVTYRTLQPYNSGDTAWSRIGIITTGYFNGTIDEVRIYNRSLSATEISALYDTGKTYKFEMLGAVEKGGLNDTPTPTASDETGLVGYWKMDDLTNGNTTDSSGQGNNGSVFGATFNSGRWDKGYNFDGSDDYINAGNSTSLNTTATALTVSFWAKADTISAWDAPIGKTHDANWYGWGFSTLTTTDTMNFFVAGGYVNPAQFANISFKSGEQSQWHHWVGTYDGAAVNIYKDGVAGISGAKTGVSAGIDDIVEIGSNKRAGALQNWDGLIDEVRIYNRSLSASEVQELYLSKGLVGYWKMDADQKNATHTFDSSGYYNHGMINGSTFTNEGKFKEAYKFDGVNDGIRMPRALANNTNLTMTAWIKTLKTPGMIVAQEAAGLSVQGLYISSGKAWFSVNSFNTPTVSTTSVNNNQWNFVAGVYNGTHVLIYVNGILEDNDATTVTWSATETDIGMNNYLGGADYVNGTIDEVRIYNRALTADEVLGLYQGTKTNKIELLGDPTLGGLNETPAPTSSNETGLVGWWKMEDLTNGNTTDSSGQGNNGVINGAALNSSGRWSAGYSFDGVNDFINISTFSNPTDTMTASAWIKTTGVTSSGGYGGIVGNTYTNFRLCRDKDRGAGKEYSFEWDNQWNVGLGIPATTVEDGKWHSLIGVYNGTHIINYFDGTEYDKYAYIGTISAFTGIIIGRNYYSASNCCYFNGTIDEVRIYNRALSPSEVKELYLSKGLVGYWKMDADQKNSTSTFDSSGYYNHGLITGATFTNEGRFKEAYKFDGNSDYINFGDINTFDGIANISASAWIKPNSATANYIILGKHAAGELAFSLQLFGANNAIVCVGNSSGGTNTCDTSMAFTRTANEWTHIAFAYDNSTGGISLYRNGALASTGSVTTPTGVTNTASNFKIGAQDYAGAERYFDGAIDEVRIYNRALTSDEVLGLYQGTKTNEFAWWSVTG